MVPRFSIQETGLEGLIILHRKPLGDNRGFLERLYCQQELEPLLNGKTISQINHTLTMKVGTVRGMHFQYPPHAEIKLVSCIQGKILDVAVDLRKNSPTFLHYHAEIITAENNKTFYIPEGFAHGFQTLSENCEVLYFHTMEYSQEFEGAINALDPNININWLLKISEMSERDSSHPLIDDMFEGVSV